MLQFSHDPDVAEQQMNAIIFYLTTFGYIDGDFDQTEKTFVKIYIRQLVGAGATSGDARRDAKTRAEVVGKFVAHFHEVFEQIDPRSGRCSTRRSPTASDPRSSSTRSSSCAASRSSSGFDDGQPARAARHHRRADLRRRQRSTRPRPSSAQSSRHLLDAPVDDAGAIEIPRANKKVEIAERRAMLHPRADDHPFFDQRSSSTTRPTPTPCGSRPRPTSS
jgi:hypothetical protein